MDGNTHTLSDQFLQENLKVVIATCYYHDEIRFLEKFGADVGRIIGLHTCNFRPVPQISATESCDWWFSGAKIYLSSRCVCRFFIFRVIRGPTNLDIIPHKNECNPNTQFTRPWVIDSSTVTLKTIMMASSHFMIESPNNLPGISPGTDCTVLYYCRFRMLNQISFSMPYLQLFTKTQ